jgi:toxin ParE1/3/4
MKAILISPMARKDLESIYKYTLEEWSEAQANTYIKLLFTAIENLNNPNTIFKSLRVNSLNYSIEKVAHHFIFCKISDDTITISRVLHKKMDFFKHL